MRTFKHVILGGGMVAGYCAKELVERGLKPGELGSRSFSYRMYCIERHVTHMRISAYSRILFGYRSAIGGSD